MNLEAIREDFPITKELIHLDNAGLSPLPTPVVKTVEKMLHERQHKGVDAFWDWVGITGETKGLLAGLINASDEEIALTQNTSEGINIVANMLDWERGDNIVLNNLEFSPNYWPWLRLRKFGVEIRVVEHKNGLITVEDYEAKVDDNTRVIALSSVAWINGLKQDIEELAKLAHRHSAFLVVDAIQSVGTYQLDVQKGPIDFLSCGGHKWLFGLLGSGFFFCRKELLERFEPAYLGWQSDEERFSYGFREYTLSSTAQRFNHGNTSIAGAHSLHAGATYINNIGIETIEKRIRLLTDHLIRELQPLGVKFFSPLEDAYRSAIINFIPSDPEAVLRTARSRQIIVCVREGGIRVSPNFYNTEDEIDQLVQVVKDVH